MNAWKLNSIAQYLFRKAIADSLGINFSNVYKTIKEIDQDGTITLRDGSKYKLELKKLPNT